MARRTYLQKQAGYINADFSSSTHFSLAVRRRTIHFGNDESKFPKTGLCGQYKHYFRVAGHSLTTSAVLVFSAVQIPVKANNEQNRANE